VNEYRKEHRVKALNDHNCFGCGALNDIGLHLEFYRIGDSDAVWTEWMPTKSYEGYGGMIHGGIICTLLDEVTAWSLYARNTWAVTAKMHTNFRKPLKVGEMVRLVGKVTRERGRVLEIRGEVRLAADDTLLAEAEATFIRVPESQAETWNRQYLTMEEGD